MEKRSEIKKIIKISVLTSIAIIFSTIDKYVSSFIFASLPGVKIGLANIIVLMCIFTYDFKDGLIVTLLKSLVAGLLFSGITSYIIGGTASLVSFLLMFITSRLFKKNVGYIGVSLIGGLSHTITQLVVIKLIYNMDVSIFLYGIYLFVISIVTSILIGLIAYKTNSILYKAKTENIYE